MQTETKKNKVIIIEDEPSHMDAMCRSFATKNCFIIKKAKTLKDYYNLISKETPNLVIADLYLPDGKAFEILSRSNASKNHYPVLITTAYGSEDIAVKAMKSGAYDYIVKSDQSFKNMYFIANKAIKEWKILQREKEAKEALKHSYEIIKAIHKNSLLFIILVDKNLNVININEYAANFLQKNVEELTGSLFGNALNCANSLKNPKGCGYSVDCKNCEIRNTILKTFKNNRSYQKKEVSMTFLKGNEPEKFNFYLSTTLIKIKEQPIVLLNILDITEQKKSERELQESEKKFRTLFNSIAEGVAIIKLFYDEENKVIDFIITNENPAFSRILGMSSDKLIKTIKGNNNNCSFLNLYKYFKKVENTGVPEKFETFFAPNKKYFRISVVSPQKGKLACVIEDITKQKYKEEALIEKNEEMNHFLATASHNL
ncbi:MAG: response regulator, partial [Bacteroidales bacterium]